MTWPTAQVKTNVDDIGDDPKQSRSDFAANVDRFNLLRAHVTSYMQGLLDDADAAAARSTLELGTAALKNTGTSGDALALLNGAANWSDAFLLSGRIDPAQITADQNNYNPAGLSGATQIFVDSDASRSVTGIVPGASADGRLLLFTNDGSFDIVLPSQNAGSTAANRFLFAGGDRTLTPDESVLLRYDGVTARWRAAQDMIVSGITGYTPVTTTSGTAHGFTAIPAGTNRITFMLDNVSLNGTNELLIQIGDAGGYETASYNASASKGGLTPDVSTSGFIVNTGAVAADTYSGAILLNKVDSNTWLAFGNIRSSGSNFVNVSSGIKTLTAELDRVQIVPTGANAFDNGSIGLTTEI